MLNSRKWWITALMVVFSLVLITGCAGNDDATENEDQETNEEANNQEGQEAPAGEDAENGEGQAENNTSLDSDADLETQLKEDEGIEEVMVQVVEGDRKAVNVDIEINDSQALSADELIEKHSEMIKEKYPDHVIDIIVVKDGQIVKQTTLE